MGESFSGEVSLRRKKKIENGLDDMLSTLNTSHFEMSELNASANLNAAESTKKKHRERTEEQA